MARKKLDYTSNTIIDEALKKIRDDKSVINQHIIKLGNLIAAGQDGAYAEFGGVLVKCLESATKNNEQMIKVIAALQRNEEFDMVNEEEEEISFDDLLEEEEKVNGEEDSDQTE
jgi:hypothetical protein